MSDKNQLVTQHLHIVAVAWRQLRRHALVKKLGRDEATAVGNLALVEASRSWRQQGEFSNYALTAIQRQIKRAAYKLAEHPDALPDWHDQIDQRTRAEPGDLEGLGSGVTEAERRLIQEIEESKLAPRAAAIEIARRKKRAGQEVWAMFNRALSRLRSERNGQHPEDP